VTSQANKEATVEEIDGSTLRRRRRDHPDFGDDSEGDGDE